MLNLNVPTRVGFQMPFTNFSLDLRPGGDLANESAVIGGEHECSGAETDIGLRGPSREGRPYSSTQPGTAGAGKKPSASASTGGGLSGLRSSR